MSYGIEYDHSMSHDDAQMYFLRIGDTWTKIDYTKKAAEWMKPLIKGRPTGLVEIPASWYIDDLPPMMFIKTAPNSHGWVDPKVVEQLWMDHFDYFYENYEEFCFPMTIHPDVSGRPHVLKMHQRYFQLSLALFFPEIEKLCSPNNNRIIDHINKHEGVQWVTFEQMTDDFKSKNTPEEGAVMPAEVGAMLRKK